MGIESWISFWNDYRPSGDNAYHHEDLAELERIETEHPKVAAQRWAGRMLRPSSAPGDLDLALTPTPFVGNLKKASIVLAMLNPGIGEFDREDHRKNCFQKLLTEQRQQDPSVTCFAVRHPETVNFKSWTVFYRRFLGPTVESEPNANWDTLAENLVIVQLFPYYSKNASLVLRGGYFLGLPSVVKARDAMQELLSTKDKEVIFRWKRQPARWGAVPRQGICSEPRWGLSKDAKKAFSRALRP